MNEKDKEKFVKEAYPEAYEKYWKYSKDELVVILSAKDDLIKLKAKLQRERAEAFDKILKGEG